AVQSLMRPRIVRGEFEQRPPAVGTRGSASRPAQLGNKFASATVIIAVGSNSLQSRETPMADVPVASDSSTSYVLDLTVKSCTELFDASAPPCLGQQVLHRDIVEHLLEEVAVAPRNAPVKLKLNVPASEAATAQVIAAAIRTFFETCRDREQRSLSRVFREG